MRRRFGDDGKRNDMPNDRHRSRRPKRRDPSETVQMSVRVDLEIYEQFRLICRQQRRTNGEMLRELLEFYGQTGAAAPSHPIVPIRLRLLSARLRLQLGRGRLVGGYFARTLRAVVHRHNKPDR